MFSKTLSPKKIAFGITAFLHLPLLFVGLKLPDYRESPPLKAAVVAIGLEQSLEWALLRPPRWEVKGINLPPLLEHEEPPHQFLSTRVLLDAEEGKIIWSEHSSSYLYTLQFAEEEGTRYRWGYIAISP